MTLAEGLNDLWPPRAELEKWLFNAASDTDPAAGALRRLVQTNPAYGGYLAEDKDITNIVQLFARRLRKRIGEEADHGRRLSEEALYKVFCEFGWKSVALVLESFQQINRLPTAADDLEADVESLVSPLDREVKGQLRMLLQTNEELSIQLSELRRAYLRELSEHRDKQRRLSAKAVHSLNSLQEEPIMFYEPLNSILDESTKDFVMKTVEERIKLEMNVATHSDSEDELGAANQRITSLEAEVRVLKSSYESELEGRRKAEAAAARWKAEAEESRRLLQEAKKAAETAMQQLEDTMQASQESKRRRSVVEQQQNAAGVDPSAAAAADDLLRQLEDKDEQLRELLKRLAQMEMDMKAKDEEAAAARKKLEEMEASNSDLRKKVADWPVAPPVAPKNAVKEVPEDNKKKEEPPKPKKKEAPAPDAVLEKAAKAPEVKIVEKIVEKVVVDEKALKEARAEIESHLKIEAELRETIRKLEKELDKKAAKDPKEKQSKDPPPPVADDDANSELQEALKNLKAIHKKELKKKDEEIERLEGIIEELQSAETEETPEGPKKKKFIKKPKLPDDSEEKLAKLKMRCDELEEQNDKLSNENDVLEQKCEMLLKKLAEKMPAEDLKAMMKTINFAPVPRKKLKKNCFDRLYDDAQRRITESRKAVEKLAEAQDAELKAAVDSIKTLSDLNRVNMLANLKRASDLTNQRFQSAMSRFNNKLPSVSEDEDAEAEQGALGGVSYHCPACGTTMLPGFGSAARSSNDRASVARLQSGPFSPGASSSSAAARSSDARASVARLQSDPFSQGASSSSAAGNVSTPVGATVAGGAAGSATQGGLAATVSAGFMVSAWTSEGLTLYWEAGKPEEDGTGNFQMPVSARSNHGLGSLRDVTPLQGRQAAASKQSSGGAAAAESEAIVQPSVGPWKLQNSTAEPSSISSLSHKAKTSDDVTAVGKEAPTSTAGGFSAPSRCQVQGSTVSLADDSAPTSPVSLEISPVSASSSKQGSRSIPRVAPQAELPSRAEAEAALHRLGRPSAKKEQLLPIEAKCLAPKHSKSHLQLDSQPLAQTMRGFSNRAAAEDALEVEAIPAPVSPASPQWNSTPVSPARPSVALRNDQMARSYIAQTSTTAPSGPWAVASHAGSTGSLGMMSGGNTRSLPSLAASAYAKSNAATPTVNKAWETPKAAKAKAAKQKLLEAERARCFNSLVQGQDVPC